MSMRLILVGRSGHGKSSTGNTLLGRQCFRSGVAAIGVTTRCEVGRNDAFGFTIVDTPGLCDPEMSFKERALEVQRSLTLCRNPHAFLLVYEMGRITSDDILTLGIMRIIFGHQVFNHCIVILTHGCRNCGFRRFQTSADEDTSRGSEEDVEHRYEDIPLMFFCSGSRSLSFIVGLCNNRVLRVENNVEEQCHIHASENVIRRIKDQIQSMTNNGNNTFYFRDINTHRQILNEMNSIDCNFNTVRVILETVDERLLQKRKKLYSNLVWCLVICFSGIAVKTWWSALSTIHGPQQGYDAAIKSSEIIKGVLENISPSSNIFGVTSEAFKQIEKLGHLCINKIAKKAGKHTDASLLLRLAQVFQKPKIVAWVYVILLHRKAIP